MFLEHFLNPQGIRVTGVELVRIIQLQSLSPEALYVVLVMTADLGAAILFFAEKYFEDCKPLPVRSQLRQSVYARTVRTDLWRGARVSGHKKPSDPPCHVSNR